MSDRTTAGQSERERAAIEAMASAGVEIEFVHDGERLIVNVHGKCVDEYRDWTKVCAAAVSPVSVEGEQKKPNTTTSPGPVPAAHTGRSRSSGDTPGTKDAERKDAGIAPRPSVEGEDEWTQLRIERDNWREKYLMARAAPSSPTGPTTRKAPNPLRSEKAEAMRRTMGRCAGQHGSDSDDE